VTVVPSLVNGPEAIRDSLAILYTVRNAALQRAEAHRITAELERLKGAQHGLAKAVDALTTVEPKLIGLRRLVPRGQANVLAFLVSSLTLAENTTEPCCDS
jgi:hypothetical protein